MPVGIPAWQAKRLLHGALDTVHHLRRGPLLAFPQLAITLDGDEAGRNAATETATRLALGVWVRIADVAGGTQPDRPTKRPCAADCVGIFYH
jgi:DNA primase